VGITVYHGNANSDSDKNFLSHFKLSIMMQKILVAVAAGVAMVNGAAHVADCFTGVACPPGADAAAALASPEAAAMTKCVTDCATAVAAGDKPQDAALCAAPMANFTAACVAEAATETGSGEDGAAGADATLPSVLAFTVGAAVAGMM